MKSSLGASQQANQWAQKKKEQMEKAAQLRAERKQLATTGEMALGGKNYSMNQEYEKPPTQNSQKPYPDYNKYQTADDIFEQPNRQSSLNKQQQQQPKYGYNQPNKPPSQEGFRKPVQPQQQISYQNSKVQESRQQYGNIYQEQSRQQQQVQVPRQPQQQHRPPSGRQDQLDFAKTSNQQPPKRNEQPIQAAKQNMNSQKPVQGRNAPSQQFKPTQQYYNPADDIPIKKGENQFNINANPEPLYECSKGCGRSFAKASLQKHEKICVKVFQKQRKPFDAQKHRIVSNEQISHIKNLNQVEKKYEKALAKKEDWRKQSEAFRAVVKAAKGGKLTSAQQNAIKEASQMNLVQCDYCGRRFNPQAAEKHIPFCASKQKIPPRQPQKRR